MGLATFRRELHRTLDALPPETLPEVLDFLDPDFQSLHHRIRQRFGRRPVLLRRVEASPERTLVFRSPRLERGRL